MNNDLNFAGNYYFDIEFHYFYFKLGNIYEQNNFSIND